jgi:hypothetical protein
MTSRCRAHPHRPAECSSAASPVRYRRSKSLCPLQSCTAIKDVASTHAASHGASNEDETVLCARILIQLDAATTPFWESQFKRAAACFPFPNNTLGCASDLENYAGTPPLNVDGDTVLGEQPVPLHVRAADNATVMLMALAAGPNVGFWTHGCFTWSTGMSVTCAALNGSTNGWETARFRQAL